MKRFNKNKKPLVLTLVIVAVVILIGYFAFAYISKAAWPFASTSSSDTSETYSPPTEQEVTDSQDAKKNNAGQEQQEGNSQEQEQSQAKPVSVAIAYAGFDETENAIDIRAFIPDVIEGNGTCTATLILNGQVVTKSSKGFIDSTTSQCEPILIPVNEFPATGTWDLTVSYASSGYKGTSSSMKVEVTR